MELIEGDIANQPDIIAIINAANAELHPGGGVAGVIHKAAGPEFDKECRSLAPLGVGEVVITKAYQLPNHYVIHCLGPIYGVNKPEDELLADCYRNILNLADSKQIASLAFPAISTGAFGYPIELAADIALKTICQMIFSLYYVKHIRLVLFSKHNLEIYKNQLTKILEENNYYQ